MTCLLLIHHHPNSLNAIIYCSQKSLVSHNVRFFLGIARVIGELHRLQPIPNFSTPGLGSFFVRHKFSAVAKIKEFLASIGVVQVTTYNSYQFLCPKTNIYFFRNKSSSVRLCPIRIYWQCLPYLNVVTFKT